MKKKIAILLPYKEKYNFKDAAAASIWVKDYLKGSNLRNKTLVFGDLAKNKKQVIKAIQKIKQNYNKYEEKLEEFSKKFDVNGAENAAKIVSEILETKK